MPAPQLIREVLDESSPVSALGQRTTELDMNGKAPLRPRFASQVQSICAQLPEHLHARRVIGEGGSSIVLEAFHTRLKVSVAVKVLAVRGEVAEAAQQRMMREAELYARLEDPRVPRVYDVNELPDGTPYVVMEMVPGSSLELLLAQSRVLPVQLAIHIARELLLALRAVHARGVLHRDIKPANVILSFQDDGSCQVRLVDFGIAKAASINGADVALTQRGALVGTPQYMAPERLTGQEADLSSETYGVGVMLYEMLTGKVPFGGHNLGAIMAAVLRDMPQPLHELRADLPASLEGLVTRSISRDPAARYLTAQQMLDALDTILQAPDAALEAGSAVRRRPVTDPPAFADLDDEPIIVSARTRARTWRRTLIGLAVAGSIVTGWVVFERLQHGVPTAPLSTPLDNSVITPVTPVEPAVQAIPTPSVQSRPVAPSERATIEERDEQPAEPGEARRRQRARRNNDRPQFNYVEPSSAPRDALPTNPY